MHRAASAGERKVKPIGKFKASFGLRKAPWPFAQQMIEVRR
jgi:hypothetical protein